MSDRACAKAFRHARGNAGERFDGSRMICAIDPDGRAPLSSGCNGDSGGPLMAGTYDAPRVLGVVSYGGNGCGADHLPSVFAEVERYRSFILSPRPPPHAAQGRPRHPDRLQRGRLQRGRTRDRVLQAAADPALTLGARSPHPAATR